MCEGEIFLYIFRLCEKIDSTKAEIMITEERDGKEAYLYAGDLCTL